MIRSLKNLIIALGALCAVIIAVIGWAVFHINSQAAAVAELEQQVAQKEADMREESGLRALVEDTSPSIAYLEDRLIKKDQIVDFIEALERLGMYAGTQIAVDAVNAGEQTVTAVLSTEGSWSQVNHVLSLLEAMPRAITISELAFDAIDVPPAGASKVRAVRWKARFNIEAVAAPGQGAGSADAATAGAASAPAQTGASADAAAGDSIDSIQ